MINLEIKSVLKGMSDRHKISNELHHSNQKSRVKVTKKPVYQLDLFFTTLKIF